MLELPVASCFVDVGTGSVKNQQQSDDSESIVLNVAGRLLMFQRDRSLPQLKHKDKHKDRPVRASCSTHSRSFRLACLPFVEQLQLLFTVKSWLSRVHFCMHGFTANNARVHERVLDVCWNMNECVFAICCWL